MVLIRFLVGSRQLNVSIISHYYNEISLVRLKGFSGGDESRSGPAATERRLGASSRFGGCRDDDSSTGSNSELIKFKLDERGSPGDSAFNQRLLSLCWDLPQQAESIGGDFSGEEDTIVAEGIKEMLLSTNYLVLASDSAFILRNAGKRPGGGRCYRSTARSPHEQHESYERVAQKDGQIACRSVA